jgi:hypothetical protein
MDEVFWLHLDVGSASSTTVGSREDRGDGRADTPESSDHDCRRCHGGAGGSG